MKKIIVLFGFSFFVQYFAQSQTVTPFPDIPVGFDLPNDAVVYEPRSYPSSPAGASEEEISPSVSPDFPAIGDDNTSIPPDTHGAVGPNHVMTMLNTQVRIQDRSGTTNFSTVSLNNWWSSVGGFSYAFDPKVLYDPYNNRWIATACTDAQIGSSSVLIAVSQTSDPTGAWYRNRIDADAGNIIWADYPSIGFNKNWIVVQVNMFTNANNGFSKSQIYIFNKTNLYAGGINYSLRSTAIDGGTQVPAITYDNTLSTMYLLQTFSPNFTNSVGSVDGYLRLYTITGAIGSEVFAGTTNYPSTLPWAFRPSSASDFAPQTNTSVKIQNGDSRIQNVVYRNGSLWCAQTVFLPATAPARSAVQWWQMTTNGAVQQVGRVDDAAGIKFYAFPSISVNKFNDALIGYSSFSTNQYASASYSFRAFFDTPNTLRLSTILKAGEGRYYKTFSGTQNRWGDYSATMVDPLNDTDLWTIQEYAATPINNGLSNNDGRWGTWWGQIQPFTPANNNFTNYFSISGSLGATNGSTLRATKETGEPNHVGNSLTKSIWYRWTAPTNGNVTIDTVGSNFDTLLAVYTGSSVASLTLVTNNDNSGSLLTSRVVFNATVGTTYQIAVDGAFGAYGNVTLNWNQPTAPTFTLQPRSWDVVAGNNVTFSATAIGSPNPTYQWKFNGANISGATSATYLTNNVQTNNAGNYTVVAANTYGSVTSLVSHLEVYHSATATFTATGYTTNNQVQFTVSGVTNSSYVIQASTNLINWTPISTNIATFIYLDSSTTNYPYRFYRALYQP